jgi:class 3 adenylate cyclase/tetratricopeptide (TPR) repeat protein
VETVSILFTDMVGSTELSQRLEPDAVDVQRREHFALLRPTLAANDGREVKNLGDGLMAVFASSSAAMAAAVAMQQAVEQNNRERSDPIGLRVAISGGEVSVEEDDYFGDPVIEASRLCGICASSQILVSDAVRRMAGRRSGHLLASMGARELKGLAEPSEVYQVGWAPMAQPTGLPLPERLAEAEGSSALFGFSGRRRELDQLVSALKAAAGGARQVVFLSGEPGIGKTTLCREVARAAYELGVPVLYGRSDEDLGMAYQPFAEALGHLVASADEKVLAEHVAEDGSALAGLVPALAKRVPTLLAPVGADGDTERLRLFSAVVGLLGAASAPSGLLLVVDDLHWADRASLQLLRHVACSHQLPRVMILATYRDSDLAAQDALADTLASLRRDVESLRIDVRGLEDIEVLEMMERVAGHELGSDGVELAHAVCRETDGNPFFTTELLRHLGETGMVHQDDSGRWVMSEDLERQGLPQSVREVVGRRVARLGDETRRVLSLAAVIGRDFDLDLLAELVEVDEDRLLDVMDQATATGLLGEVEGAVGRYSFAHALIQHTLYQDLGATRRARAHRRVAEVMEERFGDTPDARAGELARHFLAATKTADTAKALRYSLLAGQEALARLAPADALSWFAQALGLYGQVSPDETLRCDLLIGLGTAQRQTGEPAHRQTLLDAAALAERLSDAGRLVRAALANNRGVVSASGEVDAERVAVLQRAIDAVGDEDSRERALLLATLCSELGFSGERERTIALASDAVALARRLNDPPTFVHTTVAVYGGVVLPDNLADRYADLGEAVALAAAINDPVLGVRARCGHAVACLDVGDRVGFDADIDACADLAGKLDHPFERWTAAQLEAQRALLAGDLAVAEAQAEAALAIGADSVPEVLSTYGAQLVELRGMQGRLDEVVDLYAQVAIDNPGFPGLRANLAWIYCELDRRTDALAVIEDDIAEGFSQLPYDTVWLPAMVLLADVCTRLAQRDAATLLYERLLPWQRQGSGAHALTLAPVAFYLGLLATTFGTYDEAESHFSASLDFCRKLEAPFWIARTGYEWAKMLGRWGRPEDLDRAQAMLTSCLDSAKRHGFVALQRRAEAVSIR